VPSILVLKFEVNVLVISVPELSKHVGASPRSNAMKHTPATPPTDVGSWNIRVALLLMVLGFVHPAHAFPVAASIQTACE
jgi:hypothetical protein